jgi:predicted RNA-binding Zn-ribbon protein involved in translation (DUF1610 family)
MLQNQRCLGSYTETIYTQLDAHGVETMKKLDCPHCGKPGISVMRKMCLGPAVPATCEACGKKVGVPYMAMLAGIPFLAAIVGSELVEPFALKTAFLIGGFVVMAVIQMRWVPLEAR